MTWAILGIGVFGLIVLSWVAVSFAVTLSKMSVTMSAERISFDQRAQMERENHRQQVQGLIDRIMAHDWESVRLHEGASLTPDGAFLSPSDQREEQEEIESRLQGANWGHASALKDFFSRGEGADAERLAAEDDLDGRDAELAQ